MDEIESQDRAKSPLYWHPMAIGREALVFWDRDDPEEQLRFLKSIDASYFEYVANVNEPLLDGESAKHAAVALRIAYSHALESLFALIGAALQAPDYPVGWMLKYKVSELQSLVENITMHEPILARHQLRRPTWDKVATILFPFPDDIEGVPEAKEALARLWRNLAREFTDERFQNEYNSLKHGFRASQGPSYLAMGLETTPGVPAPRENMRLMSRSEFGSTFPTPRYIKGHQQYSLGSQNNNWNPRLYALRVPLIAASMRNAITYLRVRFGDESDDLRFEVVTSEMIDAAWDDPNPPGMRFFGFTRHIRASDLPAVSKEEILATYDERDEEPSIELKKAEGYS